MGSRYYRVSPALIICKSMDSMQDISALGEDHKKFLECRARRSATIILYIDPEGIITISPLSEIGHLAVVIPREQSASPNRGTKEMRTIAGLCRSACHSKVRDTASFQ